MNGRPVIWHSSVRLALFDTLLLLQSAAQMVQQPVQIAMLANQVVFCR